MNAQHMRSQLLFPSFIFANEVVFSWGSLPSPAAPVSPSEFGPCWITLKSDRSPEMTTQPLFTVKSSTDRAVCSTSLIVRRYGRRCTVSLQSDLYSPCKHWQRVDLWSRQSDMFCYDRTLVTALEDSGAAKEVRRQVSAALSEAFSSEWNITL